MLYLIRHVPVVVERGVPAPEWRLSEEGRRLARRLAGARAWRTLAAVASSPEQKALETAAPVAETAGVPLAVEADLREVERPGSSVLGRDEYVALVERFFAHPGASVDGWEPADRAAARFDRCVSRLLADSHGHLAVVAHGLVMSLYVARLEGRRQPDVAAWAAIPLPAVAAVDPDARRVVRPFVTVDEFLAGGG